MAEQPQQLIFSVKDTYDRIQKTNEIQLKIEKERRAKKLLEYKNSIKQQIEYMERAGCFTCNSAHIDIFYKERDLLHQAVDEVIVNDEPGYTYLYVVIPTGGDLCSLTLTFKKQI